MSGCLPVAVLQGFLMKTSYSQPVPPDNTSASGAAAYFYLISVAFLLSLSFSTDARAVPAAPEPFEESQADGSRVKIFLKGDEFYNWYEDERGYSIIKDTSTKDWVYSEKGLGGSLKKTPHKVGRADPKRIGLTKHLLEDAGVSAAKARRRERDTSRRPRSAPSTSISISGAQPLNSSTLPADRPQSTPITTGTMKNLVILARFSDQSSTYTQAQFDSLFNQVGYTTDGAVGSVKDFYTQVSYGKLTVNSTVSQWVTLPQPAAYYGAGNPDANPRQMVIDAINALDAAGFDFSTMDSNSDGEVDGLTIIHSGLGQEFGGNSSDYIWSHQWQLVSPVVKDGKSMLMYHTESEVRGWASLPYTQGIARIGVISHETGHFLGLPDLYDYGGDSSGVGNFCLMAGGSWNGDYGTSPAHPSAYNKTRLSWVTPTTLSSAGSYSLARVEDSDTAIYKFSGAGFAATEYFLMENKQAYGFDTGLPGGTRGMLIWHVDETIPDYGANDNQAHYKVDLEEASGTQDLPAAAGVAGDDSDYFRVGTLTEFGDNTTPNSRNYAATANLVWEVQNISASGNPMTFYYGATDTTPPSTIASVYDGLGADISYTTSGTQLSANWTASADAQSGVAKYYYAIGTTAGATNVVAWTDNGTATSVTKTGLSLSNGQVYYFTVKAQNGANLQSTATNSNGQTVDTTAPSTPAAVSDGTGADTAYTTSSTQLSANWTASADAQSGVAKYYYAIGTSAGATNVVAWTDNGTATSVTKTGLSLSNGQVYYFTVKSENGAGLQSAAVNSNGQTVDTTAPSTPAAVSDGAGADTAYTTSISQLSANWSASADAQSGVAKYYYAIGTSAGATNVVAWTDNGTATSVTKTGLSLSNGQIYYFTVKAENGAGLQSAAVNSNGQTVDNTPPSAPVSVNDGTGADISETLTLSQLSANWSASADAQSGLAKYYYAIGTTVGGTDTVDWTDNGTAVSVTKTGLSLVDGQVYYFSVKAENGSGLQSSVSSSNGQQARQDVTPPADVAGVRDGSGADAAWAGSQTQLSANWDASSDAESGVARYDYAIGTTAGGTNVVAWTSNGTNTSVTKAGLSLADGQIYYFQVKAVNGVGLESAAVSSDGQTIDATAPSAPGTVRDGAGADAAYTTSATQLSANWTASADAQSGVAKYYYAIGTTAGATDVVTWTDNGAATSVTKTGLSLSNGQIYYFTVKAQNGAGLQSAAANSNGQTVDTTAPSNPATVNDGTGADVAYTNSVTQLSANWTASADAQSGVVKYYYAIGTTAGATDVVTWTDNGTATSVTKTGLSLSNGQIYYFTVKAENGAGLQSAVANSNGQTADTTAPSTPASVNDGAGADTAYTTSATQLSANWAASADAQSGVAKYYYAIGTTAGAADVVDWTDNGAATSVTKTGLSLSNGQIYYFTVKAENGSGVQSAAVNSNGQTVDTTTPSAPASVNDGAGADTAYTTSATQLSANWTASVDAQSGVTKYYYAIGTTAGATNVVAWTDNGTATSVTKTGLSLSNGQIYYFTVKAENGSGLQSAAVNSNGQTVDTTAPSTPAAVNDGAGADAAYTTSATQLSANWTASADAQSGVVKYYYAIGTTAGATNVVAWTDNGTATSVTKTGLGLSNGQIYYFTVKVENGAGLQSAAVNSNGQTVDNTPPSAPASVNDGTSVDISETLNLTQLSANWAAGTDAQSGVAKYYYAIGTTAGATDVVTWTDNGAAASVTKTGLSLENGQTYYFSVKAENGSGLQSTVSSSDGLIVREDITPPADVALVRDGSGADAAWSGSLTQLTANWDAGSDAESDIARYDYAIGTTAGGTNIVAWTSNGANTSVTKTGLSLADGQTYYFQVKAVNGAGLESAAVNSNGQTIDATAPSVPATVRDGASADIAYTNSAAQLSANWESSSDAQSGVAKYYYAIGTTAGATNVVAWTDNGTATSVTKTGLSLASGQIYYFSVKVENVVGLLSASSASNGQTVDTVSPTARIELEPASPLKSGAFTARLTVVEANPVSAAPALSYTPSAGSGVSLPLSQVSPGVWSAGGFIDSRCSTGTAVFSFSVPDAAGNTGTVITEGGSFIIDTSISNTLGGTVENSDGSGVIVPPDASPDPLWLNISTPSAAVLSAADSRTYDSAALRASVLSREFTAVDADGDSVSGFSRPVTVKLAWLDADNDGRVDWDYIREELLRLYYLEPAAGKWVPVEGARRDMALNTIEADVAHFSVYAIRSIASGNQEMGDIKAYPSPCYFSGGNLTIAGIPVDSTGVKVLIYNSAGELVRALKPGEGIDSYNIAVWDGRNSSGAKAASGLYLYQVRTVNHGKTFGKFSILW